MIRFTKMHGAGNDYVYVNGYEQAVDHPDQLAVEVSDRHRGIGSDGLILILPPDNPEEADVRMRMFNADGSEAEMCGNGVRCVAKYAYDHGLTRAQPMRIQTRAGTRLIRYELDEHGRLALATVNMGPPELRPSAIPVRLPDLTQVVNHPMQKLLDMDDPPRWAKHCGLDARITCVSMGNPHAVLYCDVVSEVPLETVGPRIEQHSLFPERINVHFVEVRSPREAIVRHWERGSGPTLACGTGACAVCVAGVLTGRTDRRLRVHVPGGELTLEWDAASDHVMMTGPAAEVFSGEWPG